MHRSDVVLIGPIEPLLPRAVRVPLPVALAGAVGLLCAALAAAVGIALRTVAVGLLPLAVSGANGSSDVVPMVVVSDPVGAEILAGNRDLGHTPASVDVAVQSLLVLHRDGFLDAYVAPSTSSVSVQLWRAQPDVQQVRPPMPGTSIASADFLPDGRLAH